MHARQHLVFAPNRAAHDGHMPGISRAGLVLLANLVVHEEAKRPMDRRQIGFGVSDKFHGIGLAGRKATNASQGCQRAFLRVFHRSADHASKTNKTG